MAEQGQHTHVHDPIVIISRAESRALNEEMLALVHHHREESKNIAGVRIVYYDPNLKPDHSDKHNSHWDAAINNGCLEAGTVTQLGIENEIVTVTICWDCGEQNTYSLDSWQYFRVYSLGPTGYLGQMVFCDKCLEPSRGLAFRLAEQNKSVGDLYDLCHKCYDECDDEHVKSCFYCNIPSGNIDLEESGKVSLPPRQGSLKYEVVGIFKHAIVEIDHSDSIPTQPTQGEVLNIVHERGYDLRKASYYDSCTEIKPDTPLSGSGKVPLVYKEAGSGGKVELKAVKPGEAPSPMPVEHYPTLGIEIIEQLLTYKQKLVRINEGEENECDCFMRFKDGGCYSLTISGTRLTRITDPSIWERCKDLKIVILLMNELNDLPPQLKRFSETIELVCIQHNRFTKVPPILFDLKRIKHLNLHGNQISKVPEKMKIFTELERLKFGYNKLYSLPDIFGSFRHLTEITFNNNFLTRLPLSFSQLEQLKSIDLRDNSFTCIPAPLLKLEKLEVLYMDWNRIQRLAPLEDHEGRGTFSLLRRLVSLRLSGNPVYEQLGPRLNKDGTNLLELVTNQATFSELHRIPISRALRVLVLGSCGSGKTSIVEALSFNKYVTPTTEAHHDHTVGIMRFSIPVRMKSKHGRDLVTELRLWDFAGERSYIMMNNLFLAEGTLIWIAVNFQTYKCTDESFRENIASWLQQVVTKSIRPVVWIIGTHTDKCTKEEAESKVEHIRTNVQNICQVFQKEIEKELYKLRIIEGENRYKDRSPACIQESIKKLTKLHDSNVPCLVAENLKVLSLTNTYSFTGFEDLRNHITNFLQDAPFDHLAKELTECEQRAADKLRQRAEELLAVGRVPVLDDTEVQDIIKGELGHSSSNKQVKRFLQYLYQAGHLLVCKPHPDVILDVDWLIDLLKQVFHHDFPAMINEKKSTFAFSELSDENIDRAVEIQQRTGIVERQVLEALWPLKVDIFKHLTELLETYGLAFETTDSLDPSGYLFPWLVTESCPRSVPFHNQRTQITVSYDFSPCLPSCFLQQLAVKCKRHFSIGEVFKDCFSVLASKRSSLKQDNYTVVTVYVFRSREKNKMCGKVDLLACTQPDAQVDTLLIIQLWHVVMTIIKEMEALLCHWTFYGNLRRKVYCPECNKHFWDLQIHKENNLDKVFICFVCSKTIRRDLVAPPNELQIGDFVDRLLGSYGELSQTPPPPMPHTLQRSLSNQPSAATSIPGRIHPSYSFPTNMGYQVHQAPTPDEKFYSCPTAPIQFSRYHYNSLPFMPLRKRNESSVCSTPIQEEADGQFEMEDDREAEEHEQIVHGSVFPINQSPSPSDDHQPRRPVMETVCPSSVNDAQLCHRQLLLKDCILLAVNIPEGQCSWKHLLIHLGLHGCEEKILRNADDFILSGAPPQQKELIYHTLYEWVTKQGQQATVSALATAVINAGVEDAWLDAFSKLLAR